MEGRNYQGYKKKTINNGYKKYNDYDSIRMAEVAGLPSVKRQQRRGWNTVRDQGKLGILWCFTFFNNAYKVNRKTQFRHRQMPLVRRYYIVHPRLISFIEIVLVLPAQTRPFFACSIELASGALKKRKIFIFLGVFIPLLGIDVVVNFSPGVMTCLKREVWE